MNPAFHRSILYTLTVIFNCLASTRNCHYLCLLCLNTWGSNKAMKSIARLSSLLQYGMQVKWTLVAWKGTSIGPSVHPSSIIHPLLLDSGSQGVLEPIPAVLRWLALVPVFGLSEEVRIPGDDINLRSNTQIHIYSLISYKLIVLQFAVNNSSQFKTKYVRSSEPSEKMDKH